MGNDLAKLDEAVLIKRSLGSDRAAFGELVRRYEKSLYNIVFGVVAEAELARDVTQETFLRSFQFLERYRRSFRFSTWLFRIGVNLAISKLRRIKLESDTFSSHGITEHGLVRQAGARDPLSTLIEGERADRVLRAIRELSERYRAVLLMRYCDGLSCREIGQELGISANSVSIILHRSKMKLREFLDVEAE